MCRKSFSLISILLLSLASASQAIVIGDFEDGLGGWGPAWEGAPVLTVGTTGVTSGAASLDLVTGGGYWILQYNGPVLDMSEATSVQLDLTMRVADFPDGTWTKIDKLAINSDIGWREFPVSAIINRDTGEPAESLDWGTWSGDQNRTVVWDLSGADWTGLENSTFFQVIIAVQDGSGVGIFHIDNVQIVGAKEIPPPPRVPFSLKAVGDVSVANDPKYGPDQRNNGSGLEARDIPDRREVILISYDVSELKGRDLVSDVSLSNFSHDQHGEVNVYGVIEDLDLLDVESLTWNTAPGVKNDPTPELNSPVELDPNDLTDVLLTFGGPGQTGVRFSTDTSAALADFINSDTDGIITLLIAPAAEGNQLIVRARTHSAGGTFLEGNVGPKADIAWVSFHPADDAPGAGAAGAGFTEAPDKAYTDLLAGDGYNVTRYVTTGTPDMAALEAADLVIISRSVNSGHYSNASATIWNGIRAPMIIMSGYTLRSSRMGFTTGTNMPDTTGDIALAVTDPNHPIFAGIPLTDGVMDNPFAGVVIYPTDGTTVARGISINDDPINPDGTVLGVIAAPSDPNVSANGPVGGMVIGEWPAGAVLTHSGGAGTDILAGPRLVFLSGAREASGISSETAGMYDLYADGAQMLLNAVAYMLVPQPIVENGSFELPGTDKFKAWDGEKAGESGAAATDVPGWSSDSTPVDSGVETGWGATDGEWTGFLKGADPSIWQLTGLVLRADDVVTLKVDAKNNWQATTLRLSLYIEVVGTRLTLASADVELTDAMQEFALTLAVADQPLAAGSLLGVELDNVSAEGESWIGLDNVRVELGQ